MDQKLTDRPALVGKLPSEWVGTLLGCLGGWPLIRKLVKSRPNSPFRDHQLSGTRRCTWNSHVSVDVVKKIKDHFDVSFNDVLISALSGAFARYAEERKHPVANDLVAIPFSFRSKAEPKVIDNHFSIVLLELPMTTTDRAARLRAAGKQAALVKRSWEPFVQYNTFRFIAATQSALGLKTYRASSDKTISVVTNLPGPPAQLTMNGTKVLDMVAWVPTSSACGIGISFVSYLDKVSVGVNSDIAVMDEPRRLVELIEDEITELSKIVTSK